MKRMLLVGLVSLGIALPAIAGERAVTHVKEKETGKTEAQRELLIGNWKGEAPVKGGGRRSWVTQRLADGTFRADFTMVDVFGTTTTQSEAGIWGTSAGIYFTATRAFIDGNNVEAADTSDPALYDVYKIVRLDGEIFEYENPSTGNRFVMKRLPQRSH